MPTHQSNAATLAQNKALTRQFVDRINAQDLAGAFALLAPGWVDHSAGLRVPAGEKGAKAFFATLFMAFPDMYTTVEDMIAEGDKVVTRLQVEATHTGAMLGAPATGKRTRISAIDIHRIVDGKFIEHWCNSDDLGMLQQLGLIPPPQRP
jgi:steroid delta-isomerase-like uncharacterized protein